MAQPDLYKGEWEFLKLLLGLNAATFGGWFLAQDKIVTSIIMGVMFSLVLFLFGYWTFLTLSTVLQIVQLEHQSWMTGLRDADGQPMPNKETFSLFTDFAHSLRNCIYCFIAGLGSATTLIIISMFHRHLPVP